MQYTIPIVLDTDIGTDIDDTLALLLALASPELNVLGVTTVDGDVDLRARIAVRLLGLAGRADIPVFRGCRESIGPGRMATMLGHEGIGGFVDSYDGPEAIIQNKPAEEWLIKASHDESFHLVAIGPFTNVAAALETDPTFAERLLHITVMGGMVHKESYPKPWQDYLLREGIDFNHLDRDLFHKKPDVLRVSGTIYQKTEMDPVRRKLRGYDVDEFGDEGVRMQERITQELVEAWGIHFN